ncbi:hypothetical protein BDP81DRAFT_433737 [Colletotrichum phormii]|uniref:Uncharacterized protein n=1 Tax=Colletotrichum phormii TaxID=359342 RepID=A0AAI9ZM10_9PEZI|nr:uncharacterized protein BDP81DRAFT_433737 [Colletotrichum phormii]KAK1634131.1 hypothetical protein BDP81DRAFT_433737 [Colletotrichum phormii]
MLHARSMLRRAPIGLEVHTSSKLCCYFLDPPSYAASIYMIFGRLITLLDAEKHSLIRVKWITKLFLLGDIVSIAGQAIGGGSLASAGTMFLTPPRQATTCASKASNHQTQSTSTSANH